MDEDPDTAAELAEARRGKRLTANAERLMAMALELFAQRDFASVSIKDIAKAAEVNTALIYYYFDSKEGLFQATLANAVAQALDKYRALKERHTNPVDLISDWFDTQRELKVSIRQMLKIMIDYSSTRTQVAGMDEVIQQFYRFEVDILASSVRAGIEMGIFRPVDPERAGHLASTHLDGIFVRSIIHKDLDIGAALDDLKKFFWEYLGHTAARPEATSAERLR